MYERVRRLVTVRPGSQFLLVFALTILLPGLLLAIVGVRALLQERRVATQQMRERLDLAVDSAVADFQRELRGWHADLEQIERTGLASGAALPDRIRGITTDPDAGVILVSDPAGLRVWPTGRVLYQPDGEPESPPAIAGTRLAEAESVELREKDYARAIDLYFGLLGSAAPTDRALLVVRLARTYRKAGRHDEALRAYRDLQGSADRVAGLPADLIARYELCGDWPADKVPAKDRLATALDLYRRLAEGRWTLDQSRYLFYAAGVRQRLIDLHAPTDELARLTTLEDRKRALTEAAAELTDLRRANDSDRSPQPLLFETRARTHIAFVRAAASGQPTHVTALVAKDWLMTRMWRSTFASPLSQGFDVAVQTQDGDVLSLSTPDKVDARLPAAPWVASREVPDLNASWHVRAWPRDPAALSANLARRQAWYVVLLALVVASLGFGAYLTQRVVKKELEIARLKSDFVSTVSHEFRSPLTGIRQLGEMLMRGRVPDDRRRQEYYERITRESDRLARLVENLLDFSRMEEGRREYRRERLDTAAWLRGVVDDCRSQFADNQVSIVASIPEELPPLDGDREALTSAVQNLLDNAVKYSPGRDVVWLDAVTRAGHLSISVRDNGVGIAPTDRERIFDKFHRGSGEIVREVKGAGLGLSLVQHVVRAHEGRVTVESAIGRGSTFTIEIPHAAATSASRIDAETARGVLSRGKAEGPRAERERERGWGPAKPQ